MTLDPNKITFALSNSLVDAKGGQIPTFLRGTPTTLETDRDGDAYVKRIAAYRPAIRANDGSIVVEPPTRNEISWNADPQHPSWVRGSSVQVFEDRALGVDSTYKSSSVSWINGLGNSQIIRKSVYLEAGTDFVLSAIFRLQSGSFRPGDVIRLTGGVVSNPTLSLSPLNLAVGKRKVLSLPFRTGGGQPILPGGGTDYYSIVSVAAGSIVVNFGTNPIAANALVGAQLFFTGSAVPYLVSTNTATNAGGIATITVTTPTLVVNGITTSNKVKLAKPPRQQVDIEIYCENAATIEWGGIQIEAKQFRTSMVVQKDDLELRSGTLLRYRLSPFASLSNFGFFLNLRHWAGDGFIFNAGLVKVEIVASKLVAAYGSTQIATPTNLPASCKIFTQISIERNVVELYVDKKLIARQSISSFVANAAAFDFSSSGVRIFSSAIATKGTLSGGAGIAIGDVATGEIADLFDSGNTIASVTVLARTPELILPTTIVPGIVPEISSAISGRNVSARKISVVDASQFVVNKPIKIYNNNIFILQANVLAIVGSEISLDVDVDIVRPPGSTGAYRAIQGKTSPGRATIRFPFDPIDVQEIVGVSPSPLGNDNRLTLNTSSLSFVQGRAIVQTNLDRFVAEVIVTSVIPATRQIAVDDLSGIAIGHKISQPTEELLIDPSNYLAAFVQPYDKISVVEQAQNGVIVENANQEAIPVSVAIKVFL